MYISVAACVTAPEDEEAAVFGVAVGVVVAAADEGSVALVMHFCSISTEFPKANSLPTVAPRVLVSV